MSAPHTAKSPTAIGLNAEETADNAIVTEHAQERKKEATLIAQFALRRHAVHKTVEGGYVVCRDAYAKYCTDLAALEAFAVQVGAA